MKWSPEGRRLIVGASSGEFTLWNGFTFNFETILQVNSWSFLFSLTPACALSLSFSLIDRGDFSSFSLYIFFPIKNISHSSLPPTPEPTAFPFAQIVISLYPFSTSFPPPILFTFFKNIYYSIKIPPLQRPTTVPCGVSSGTTMEVGCSRCGICIVIGARSVAFNSL